MNDLRPYIWVITLVVFVGTLPHAVGAMFTKTVSVINDTAASTCEPSKNYMKKLAKQVARGKVIATYKSTHEWKSLLRLWDKESRWDYEANNPHSTAFGIPQLLRLDENTPMVKQIDLGLKYIKARYGTPTKALAFHNQHGWY
jgi:hypothetical protein